MNHRGDSTLWQLVDVGVAVVVPIISASVGWLLGVTFDHAQRISAIEASAYTKAEAKEDNKVLTKSIDDIKTSLHKIDKQSSEVAQSLREIQIDVKNLEGR